ncbi:MAG TPA: pyruvate, phosphate dikinase, partial [Atribacterota bacterium]|nr:pyruvate, phosphate dikinase [Atribacterota bacterium]
MKKYVYFFNEGKGDMKSILGGKGAGLAEMTRIGLPVPQGFTITTEVCVEYYKNEKKYPQGLEEKIEENLKKLEQVSKKGFGDSKNPLLVSVRSGAPISMPGMMDTVLNLGLNDLTIRGVIEKTKNERFAYDSYRRFLQMFGNVVLGIEHDKFEHILEAVKKELKVKLDTEIVCDGLKILVERYKKLIKKEIGEDFPQEPKAQLRMAIDAVFNSWNTKRAVTYRRINKIPDDLGTAVNVQEMVFGNMGEDSGTGVGFTRNPSTGEKENYGEYLLNAQGEDVVAGIRTPLPLSNLKNDLPVVYEELIKIVKLLEKHYRDVQDYEFTIEKGKLYLLQTRTGKRTAQAALKIAVDMVEEGIINKEEAVLRVEPNQLNQLLHRRLDPNAKKEVIAKGLPASPGAAYGKVVFTADEAEVLGKEGEKVILVRAETTPDDIHGMVEAQGVLTSRGGMTSHAAVVARGMGKACVAG